MTREELRNMGVSDENIEKIMSDFGKEQQKTNKLANAANDLKAEKEKSEQLQKQLNEINEKGMSELEKSNKAVDEANRRIELLEAEIAKNRQIQNLAEIGIVGEEAENLFDETGTINYKALGEIIKQREEAAGNAKVQEIASRQGNPGGCSSDCSEKEVSMAEKIVSKMYDSGNKAKSDIISNYI